MALAVAVERRDWDSVALYLLLGVTEAAALLPPESFSALLDMLGGAEESGSDGGAGTIGG